MKVVVIGAGLGGLALAQRLVRAGIDVEVYERDSAVEARFQGYRIGFGGPGMAALEGAVPARLHPLLDAVSGLIEGTGRAVDSQLNVLEEKERDDDEGRMFDRNVLRHLLIAGLDDQLRFDMKLDRYEELPDGRVRAHFADGTTVDADVLVGADGMGSTVRRQLLPHIGVHDLPVYGAIGRTPIAGFEHLIPGWSTVVSAKDVQLMLGRMVFQRPPVEAAAELAPDVRLPDTPSYIRWVLMLPGAPETLDLQPVLDLIEDWHPDLKALIAHADTANSGVSPIKEGDAVEPWPTRAVTLLGDAGHPAPPGGLGANLAMVDAEVLTDKLIAVRDGRMDKIAALAGYERTMCENAKIGRESAARAFKNLAKLRAEA
ncbi:FAD-dependent oxidoreductase [Kutzneria kofuensis]|uniref:2-polyprenyl-6-methoxyphenol hydroxylase-like FAD-dependent oxidoreductase n=1 Tax=Kutzneria kofuensis TaxID=103725 RepID=A0A7W9KIR3_9PSEU|nr:FAD-dependent monooxygenase [Kutzneria kofuensis]MBB5893353.1 2-polyprenyl-6-methoxyphenol hydroxylase-like FAD-dependent oxidoreductase [Kutzneria kofuensis]